MNLNKENANFIDFLSTDIGLQIFRENMFSVHLEAGNNFFDKYNTGESTYELFKK